MKGEQYKTVAQAIQRASELRVWVALTKDYLLNVVTPFQIPGAVDGAIAALKRLGFKGNSYVGIAHSLSGLFLRSYAKKSNKLKAVVMMASYLERNTNLGDFPLPVLTLAAELDGQTRISRIVVEYAKLMEEVSLSQKAVYRNPVICVEGANHAQFASGPMPGRVKKMNPEPDVSEAEAHARIGEYVSSFLAVQFSNVTAEVSTARRNLENYFVETGRILKPLLDVKELTEVDRFGSLPWARVAQKNVAGHLADQVNVYNRVCQGWAFIDSKPYISSVGDRVIVNTTAAISFAWSLLDRPSELQSPTDVALKMKSKAGLKIALRLDIADGGQSQDCVALNELALNVALNRSTAASRARYSKRGLPVVFEKDIVRPTGFLWATTPFTSWQDNAGLHVRAVRSSVPSTSSRYQGNLFCKVLSPYRALEWVVLDSLKPY